MRRDITATIVAGNAFIEQRLPVNAVAPRIVCQQARMDDVCFGLAWRFDFEFDAMRVASIGNKDWVSVGCRRTGKIPNTGAVFIRRRWDRHQFCDIGGGTGDNAAGRGSDWLGGPISKPNVFVGYDVADCFICSGRA